MELGFGCIGILVPPGNKLFLFCPYLHDICNLCNERLIFLFAYICSWTTLVSGLKKSLALLVRWYFYRCGAGVASLLDGRNVD